MTSGLHGARAHRVRALLLATLALAGLARHANAQQGAPSERDALIGVGASFGTASISASIPVYGGDPACGVFGDATSTPFMPSLSLRFPRLFADEIGLALRLGLAMQSAEFTTSPTDPQRQPDPEGRLVDVSRELRLESSLSTVSLDLPVTIAIGDLAIAVGPSVGLYMGRDETRRDVISAPSFAAGERDITGATTLTGSALAAGVLADLSYGIPLGERLVVSPHVEARLGLTSPYEETSWSQLTIAGGVDLLLDITGRPAPPVVIATPVVIDTPRTVVASPTVTVSLRSIDSTGAILDGPAEVIYRDVVERRHLPLIPAIFFDSASAGIPPRARLLSAESKPNDVAALLGELSTLEAQSHLLNILGERLRANRNLAVTLVGSTSGNEDRTLAKGRAEAVRGYLLDVWRVDPSQVVVEADNRSLRLSSESTAEGRAENRRVEVIARDAAALRPVLIERRIAQAIMPVSLALRVTSSAPAVWSARISDRGGDIVRVDSVREPRRSITIQPDEITPESTSLSAQVSVAFTSPGARTQSQAVTIPLTWRSERTIISGSTERLSDRERTTWQLLGFNFNSPDLLDRHRDELRGIVAAVGDSAHVVVTGYSDRLGDEGRNLELSRERAERVAAALRDELARRGTRSVVVEAFGAGVDETRFSNDLPEGRFLSRGVTVVAEQRAR